MLSENAKQFKKHMGSLWTILRTPNTLWHTTSIKRLESIFATGIKPSNGSIESDYPQSLGSFFKAICLFDFQGPQEKQALEQEGNWGSFLVGDDALKVFIGIDKRRLSPQKIIEQSSEQYRNRGFLDEEIKYKKHIPYVECWYVGNIETFDFKTILLVKRSGRPYNYEIIPFDKNTMDTVLIKNREWLSLEEEKERDDFAKGIISPKILLEKTNKDA